MNWFVEITCLWFLEICGERGMLCVYNYALKVFDEMSMWIKCVNCIDNVITCFGEVVDGGYMLMM